MRNVKQFMFVSVAFLIILCGCDNHSDEIELIQAVRENNKPMLDNLIKKHVDLDIKDASGKTAIMYAYDNSNLDFIQLLLSAGANNVLLEDDTHKVLGSLLEIDEKELKEYKISPVVFRNCYLNTLHESCDRIEKELRLNSEKKEINNKTNEIIGTETNHEADDEYGITKEYYENGKLKSEINVKNYTAKEYYENGKLKAEAHFNNWKDSDKKNVITRIYYESGNLKSEIFSGEGDLGSTVKSYNDDDNTLKSVTTFLNGKSNMKTYYKSGKLKSESNYKDDKPYGLEKDYYENGKLKSETDYSDDETIKKTYYDSEKIRTEAHYKDGKLNGMVKAYYENGNLLAETLHKNGKEVNRKLYNENGVIAGEEFYQNGEKIKTVLYDENGDFFEEIYEYVSLSNP